MYCLLPHLVLMIARHISMLQVHNVFRGGNASCIPIEASSLSELLLNFNDVYIFQAVSEQSISALRNNRVGEGSYLSYPSVNRSAALLFLESISRLQ